MSSNHAIHCCIQHRLGAAEAAHLRQRRIEQEFGARHGDEIVIEIHDHVDLVVDDVDLGRNFGVEESACGNLERKRIMAPETSTTVPASHCVLSAPESATICSP